MSPRNPPDDVENAGGVETAGPAFEDANELVAIHCDGCRAYLPVTPLAGAAARAAHSAHIGRPHEGCIAKGTWCGEYQLGLALGGRHG